MNLRIAGMGWITPLGRGIDQVWDRLLRGEQATAEPISDSVSDKTYCAFRVPAAALKDLPPHPRLRRASAISRFAAGAGLDAIACARSAIGEIDTERIALVFGVSNGGVIYTKRFTTTWSRPAHNLPVPSYFRKPFLMLRRAISLRSSESRARVTRSSATARSA